MKKTYIQPNAEFVEMDKDICDEIGGISTVDPDEVLSKRNNIRGSRMMSFEDDDDDDDDWNKTWN